MNVDRGDGQAMHTAHPTTWYIELFDGLQATRDDQTVTHFRSRHAALLLAYLACYRRRHPRGALVELFWPDSPPERGRTNLRTELSSLRRQLEPPGVPPGTVIITDRAAVQLSPACLSSVTEFEAARNAALRAGTSTERIRWLTRVVELYRGELLPGFFADWVLLERQWYAEAYLHALHHLVHEWEQNGDLCRALHYAHRAVIADPSRDEAHTDLIRLLSATGQHGAAQRQARTQQALLEQELEPAAAPSRRGVTAGVSVMDTVLQDQLAELAREIRELRCQLAQLAGPRN